MMWMDVLTLNPGRRHKGLGGELGLGSLVLDRLEKEYLSPHLDFLSPKETFRKAEV